MKQITTTSALLKTYRTKNKLTQHDAATRCGIVVQQFCNLEKGQVKLGYKLANKIAKGLNIPKSKMVHTLLAEYKTKILKSLN